MPVPVLSARNVTDPPFVLEIGEAIDVPPGREDLRRQSVGPAAGDVSRANLAGGIVCEEVGTAAVNKEKLLIECAGLLK